MRSVAILVAKPFFGQVNPLDDSVFEFRMVREDTRIRVIGVDVLTWIVVVLVVIEPAFVAVLVPNVEWELVVAGNPGQVTGCVWLIRYILLFLDVFVRVSGGSVKRITRLGAIYTVAFKSFEPEVGHNISHQWAFLQLVH